MAKSIPPVSDVQKLDARALLRWYDKSARELAWRVSPADIRDAVKPDPYRVWLSEIMLQQTGVVTVKPYFLGFLELWPNVEALAVAPLQDVLKSWAGLGYYARARNLHACAREVVAQYEGEFPSSAQQLMKLPGIGPYTAAAIAAICYNEPIAVVDGNVERVVARFFALEEPVADIKPVIKAHVQGAVPRRAGDFAQAMMDLGAIICAPRQANCSLCPLHRRCRGFASGDPLRFPHKTPRKKRPVRFGHAFALIKRGGDVWLSKRPDKGLLAQMSQMPTSNWQSVQHPVGFPMEGNWVHAGEIVHIFTHFRLELTIWRLNELTENPMANGWWCPPENLGKQALPSVFRKALLAAGIEVKKQPPDATPPAAD